MLGDPATHPLSPMVAVTAWTWSPIPALAIAFLAVCYARCYLRGPTADPGRASCFAVGLVLWVFATFGVVAVYAPVLFWMRALQVLLLLFVAPFLLALGRPVATLRDALDERGRRRLETVLASRPARVGCAPLTTSIAMLATPWLLYMTPWYLASMTNVAVADGTQMALVGIGFGYYYARMQTDPVPRRYSPVVSMGISVVETLGDGVLGLVLWLGPLIAPDYYLGLGRTWGSSVRVDQSIGAGILWILGDVIGVPFLLVLMRAFGADERARAGRIDAELDRGTVAEVAGVDTPAPTLWWESDPQLRDRYGRR